MSNIYLKPNIEKNWHSQNFDSLSSKHLSPGQFWGAPIHGDITEFLKLLVAVLGAKLRVAFLLF